MSCLDKNIEIKSRLPIPAFSGTTFTFKSVSDDKKLYVAKSLSEKKPLREGKKKKDSPIERERSEKDKFSLSEKLVEIYLESAKKKIIRNGCFIKCNYLQELVLQEGLSYFILKIFPSKIFLYYKNNFRVKFFYHAKVDEEFHLFDSIDKEQIPSSIFDQIMLCENWFLMYDYHCFLQIQKYAFEDECAQPIFSDFVLLRPTTKLLIDLVEKSAYDTNNNNGSSPEELKENYESKICFDISGPLFLDVHPAALEIINLLKMYKSPFGNDSLKYALAKRPKSGTTQSFKINPFKEELLKILEEKVPGPSDFSEENDFDLTGSPFSYVDSKEDLNSYLIQRNLEISDDLYTSQTTILVEVFELITSEKSSTTNGCKKPSGHDSKYLTVFWKYGEFYTCLTLEQYIYDPVDPNDFLALMGSKEDLDRYILKVAEILSCRFTKFLSIHYKNMIGDKNSQFIFLVDPMAEIGEREESHKRKMFDQNTGQISPPATGLVESDDESDIMAMQDVTSTTDYKEVESDDDSDNLEKEGIISTTDYNEMACLYYTENLQKDSEINEDEICTNLDFCVTDINLKRNIFSSATISQEPDVQMDCESSAFENHPFEEIESPDCDSISMDTYPKLTSKFEVNIEDFMRYTDHEHTEDMTKLFELISRI